MNLINLLKKQYMGSVMGNDPRFTFTREQQERIIAKYNHPKDLIERSYYQYRVQAAMQGKKVLVYNLAAFFLLLFKLVFSKRSCTKKSEFPLVCCLAGIKEDLVPAELIGKYKATKFYDMAGEEYFDNFSKKWFFKHIVKRYPFSYFFQLKVLSRLLVYSYLYQSFSPKAIANHFEYSCTSSAMTKYCQDRGVKHINFMHGEKIWYIRDSFFQFDECYVWNRHYANLFSSLKAQKDQFLVAIPPKFTSAKSVHYQVRSNVLKSDYCYYLANESHAQITNILQKLHELSEQGFVCRIRMHPRWGDHKYMREMAGKFNIYVEDATVDINDSILSTKHAVSLFSTVLFQSYILGTQIVIDDVSSVSRFNMLKKLDFIAFSLPHILLSEC